jgi:hypothetical protein
LFDFVIMESIFSLASGRTNRARTSREAWGAANKLKKPHANPDATALKAQRVRG